MFRDARNVVVVHCLDGKSSTALGNNNFFRCINLLMISNLRPWKLFIYKVSLKKSVFKVFSLVNIIILCKKVLLVGTISYQGGGRGRRWNICLLNAVLTFKIRHNISVPFLKILIAFCPLIFVLFYYNVGPINLVVVKNFCSKMSF